MALCMRIIVKIGLDFDLVMTDFGFQLLFFVGGADDDDDDYYYCYYYHYYY